MSNYNFTTIEDVNSHMDSFQDYKFGGEASFDGFCDYVWEHHDDEKYDLFEDDYRVQTGERNRNNEMMTDYLLSVGEHLGDYDL